MQAPAEELDIGITGHLSEHCIPFQTNTCVSLSLRCQPDHQGELCKAAAPQQEAGLASEAGPPRRANEGKVHTEQRSQILRGGLPDDIDYTQVYYSEG